MKEWHQTKLQQIDLTGLLHAKAGESHHLLHFDVVLGAWRFHFEGSVHLINRRIRGWTEVVDECRKETSVIHGGKYFGRQD